MAASALHQDDSVATAFFLSKDLHPGSKMTLHFTLAGTGAALPRTTLAASSVRSTLVACEAAPVPGVEALRCVTSPDSEAAVHDGSVRPVPVAGGDMVACHRMPYSYAVFACHPTTAAMYAVSLAGADGRTAAPRASPDAPLAKGSAVPPVSSPRSRPAGSGKGGGGAL
jgi:hypothetical protein